MTFSLYRVFNTKASEKHETCVLYLSYKEATMYQVLVFK